MKNKLISGLGITIVIASVMGLQLAFKANATGQLIQYTGSLNPVGTSTLNYDIGTTSESGDRRYKYFQIDYGTSTALDLYDSLIVGRSASTTVDEGGNLTTQNLTVNGSCTGCSGSTDLQDVYNNSASNAYVLTATSKDLILALPDVAIDPNFIISVGSEGEGQLQMNIGSTTNGVWEGYGALGIGTTTPGGGLSVNATTTLLSGPLYALDHIRTSYIIATSGTSFILGDLNSSSQRGGTAFFNTLDGLTLNVNELAEGDFNITGDLFVYGNGFSLGDGAATSTYSGTATSTMQAGFTLGTGGLRIDSGGLYLNVGDALFDQKLVALGNVGIGTGAPGALLDIFAAAGSNPVVYLTDGDVAHGMTSIIPTNVATRFTTANSDSGDGGLELTGYSETGSALVFRGFIGSEDPTDTEGAVVIEGRKKSGTTVQNIGSSETVLNVRNGGSGSLMAILGSGNVGIGTTSPGNVLDVNGTAYFDSFYAVATSTVADLIATSTLQVRKRASGGTATLANSATQNVDCSDGNYQEFPITSDVAVNMKNCVAGQTLTLGVSVGAGGDFQADWNGTTASSSLYWPEATSTVGYLEQGKMNLCAFRFATSTNFAFASCSGGFSPK